MKKLILLGMTTALISVSCSTAKMAQTQRAEFLKMKGDWQITSVNYDRGLSIRPFDENADAQCFVGSTWHLVPNNYSGSYAINGSGDCPSVTQPIRFEVLDGNSFQFKKVGEGEKAKNVTAGYALNLVEQSENHFVLEQNVPYQGQNAKVVYQFQRTGN